MNDNGLVCSAGEGDLQNITDIDWSLLHGVVFIETIEMEITEYIDPGEMRELSDGIFHDITNTDMSQTP